METEGPGLFFTIAAFIGGFSLLVFIHEWGHYIVGRIFGVKIETFSIGMGKELIGRTVGPPRANLLMSSLQTGFDHSIPA